MAKAIPAADAEHGGLILFDSRDPDAAERPEVSLVVRLGQSSSFDVTGLASLIAAGDLIRIEILLIADRSTLPSIRAVLDVLKQQIPKNTVLLTHPARGISAVRKIGLSLSHGEYLGFLDGNDVVIPSALLSLLRFAHHHSCALVMGRKFTFDSRTHEVGKFADVRVWPDLLGKASSRVISKGEEPRLFLLEPDLNGRLFQRDLLGSVQNSDPERLLLEDLPLHVHGLSGALRIGLLDISYVASCKIRGEGGMDERLNRHHFDVIGVSEIAVTSAQMARLPLSAGAALVLLLLKINWGWAKRMPPKDRRFFFGRLRRLIEKIPPGWLQSLSHLEQPDEPLHLLLVTLQRGDFDQLIRLSSGLGSPLQSAWYLLRSGHWGLLKRRLMSLMAGSDPSVLTRS